MPSLLKVDGTGPRTSGIIEEGCGGEIIEVDKNRHNPANPLRFPSFVETSHFLQSICNEQVVSLICPCRINGIRIFVYFDEFFAMSHTEALKH